MTHGFSILNDRVCSARKIRQSTAFDRETYSLSRIKIINENHLTSETFISMSPKSLIGLPVLFYSHASYYVYNSRIFSHVDVLSAFVLLLLLLMLQNYFYISIDL